MKPVSGGIAIESWLSSTSRRSVEPVPMEPMMKMGPLPGAGSRELIRRGSLWSPAREEVRERLAHGIDAVDRQLVEPVLERVARIGPVDHVHGGDALQEERRVVVGDARPGAPGEHRRVV